MPEGPSIVILREQAGAFVGKKVIHASSTAKIDASRLVGQRIVSVRSFGKEFLIELQGVSLRIHLMLFGSYRINQPSEKPSRLHLAFARGQMDFYACSVRYLEGPLDALYDWRGDVMSDDWDPALAIRR